MFSLRECFSWFSKPRHNERLTFCKKKSDKEHGHCSSVFIVGSFSPLFWLVLVNLDICYIDTWQIKLHPSLFHEGMT